MAEDKDAIDKSINKEVDIFIDNLHHRISQLYARIKNVDKCRPLSFEQALFTVRLNDKGAMYSHTVEETTVVKRGLANAIKSAEVEHQKNYGKIRTDGYVAYYVNVPIGADDIPLPPEVWQRFTMQSMESILRGRKM